VSTHALVLWLAGPAAQHSTSWNTRASVHAVISSCDCVVLQALEERDRLQQQLQQLSNLQQQLSSLQQQLAAATSAAAESAASAAEFQEKFIRERAVRRRLHEQLQVSTRCNLVPKWLGCRSSACSF